MPIFFLFPTIQCDNRNTAFKLIFLTLKKYIYYIIKVHIQITFLIGLFDLIIILKLISGTLRIKNTLYFDLSS